MRSLVRLKLLMVLTIYVSVFLNGCAVRTIIVEPGTPVQLREPTSAKIWVYDKDGKRVEAEAVIPAGYWCLSDPGEDK